jgi:hypothetical protein
MLKSERSESNFSDFAIFLFPLPSLYQQKKFRPGEKYSPSRAGIGRRYQTSI